MLILHVEQDGIGDYRTQEVGKNQISSRPTRDESQRHNRLSHARLDQEECRESTGKCHQGGNDKWVGPLVKKLVYSNNTGHRQVVLNLQGRILPPRSKPRMSADTARVSKNAPSASNSLRTFPTGSLSPVMPRLSGMTTPTTPKHTSSGGTWTPNSHRQPIVSAMAPPNVAPSPDPMPITTLM